MKSIAGSIIVLAGAILMGLTAEQASDAPLFVILSLVLILIGLLVVATAKCTSSRQQD